MDSKIAPKLAPPIATPVIPGWVKPSGDMSDADVAFMSGAALSSLDQLVRSDPVWSGAWRQRLALKCAAAAVRLSGRTEDDAALRDAVLLRAPGGDAGPAGNIFLAYRKLSAHPAQDAGLLDAKTLRDLTDLFAMKWDDTLAQFSGLTHDLGQKCAGRTVCRCRVGHDRVPSSAGCRNPGLVAGGSGSGEKAQLAKASSSVDGATIRRSLPDERREEGASNPMTRRFPGRFASL